MTNWYEIEFVLLKHLNLNPLVVDQLEFYRVEYLMENFKDYNERKNKKREEEEKSQKQNFNQSSIIKSSQNSFKNYLSQNKLPKFK